MFKKLICKWFDLVPAEQLEQANKEIAGRYAFLQRIDKALKNGPIRIVGEDETVQNEDIDCTIFIVGDRARVINVRSEQIEICAGTKFAYLSGCTFPDFPDLPAPNNFFSAVKP